MPFAVGDAARAIAFQIEDFQIPGTREGRKEAVRARGDFVMRPACAQRRQHFVSVHHTPSFRPARTDAPRALRPLRCASRARSERVAQGRAAKTPREACAAGRIPTLGKGNGQLISRFPPPIAAVPWRSCAYGMFARKECAL